MRRLAWPLLLATILLPTLLRRAPAAPERRCQEVGRGEPPRRWLGCAADRGARRALAGDERLLLGVPIDLNLASARDLAFVPGLTAALAGEVIADRADGGPFASVDELLRVRGVGPRRLERARPFLVVEWAADGVAKRSEER
jgi:competence protein ComEA